MQNTYWNNNGKYQEFVERLEALIPDSGAVNQPRKNRHLEKFRKAANCYYDLYNNGLFNHAEAFRRVFGIPSKHYKLWGCGEYMPALYAKTEAAMDEIILLAAMEQLGYKPVELAQ